MIEFVVCGEGSTDLRYDAFNGFDGPLAIAVRNLLDNWYSEEVVMNMVSRSELSDANKNDKPKRKAYVRGAKNPYPNTVSISAFSACLARKAVEHGDACGAILFEDMDFSSHENRDKYYRAMIAAMHSGFDSESFRMGVPMVPITRSESWMLCLIDKEAAQKSYYENLSGSDNSPNSGKKVLANMLDCAERENYSVIRDRVESYDWNLLPAPSFIFFKNRLHVVSALMLHEAFPDGLNLENTKEPN